MLNIIFAGTPDFAVSALEALLESEHQVCAVYTQPDRPAGRGQQVKASPVKEIATSYHLPIFQPESLRDPAEQQRLKDLGADLMVVVAYGLILPPAALQAPRLGCINIHASLLPRWRGAAPIQRAILAGDDMTGVTIMQMDAGLDTGPVLGQLTCAIGHEDTSQDLHDRLASMGAIALMTTLNELEQGKLKPLPQDDAQASYAAKITKTDAIIDWKQSALAIDRQVRAFNPSPGAHTQHQGQLIKLWRTAPHPELTSQLPPGTVTGLSRDAITVATGAGTLDILELQLPGGRPMSTWDFLHAPREWLEVGKTKLS